MKRIASLFLVAGLAACGGPSSTTNTNTTGNTGGAGGSGDTTGGGGGGGGERLPWEGALTEGARFEFDPDMDEDPDSSEPLTVVVGAVTDSGGERTYALDWGDHSGPSKIVVRGDLVLIGDASPEEMEESWDLPGGILCYAEDYSNPDGCEDVCEASLCLNESGFVSVGGLYAPNYLDYSAR